MKDALGTHRNLDVWQLAMDLVVKVYGFSNQLPDLERFGLVTQLRRAAISIPSNIAEGAARGSSREFARFLLIARGSLAEIETQLELAERLHHVRKSVELNRMVLRVGQMLTALTRRVSSVRLRSGESRSASHESRKRP
jgi:four helix bundle protein